MRRLSSCAASAFLLAAAVAGCGDGRHGGSSAMPAPAGPVSGPSVLRSNLVQDRGYRLHVLPTVADVRRQSAGRHILTSSGSGALTYHGGPVQVHPTLYVVYWGWTSDPSGEAPYLNTFLNNIGSSGWLNTDTQYSSSTGGSITNPPAQLAGTWSDSTTPPAVVQTSDFAAEALRAVAHFGYAADANYIIATPTGRSAYDFPTNGGNHCAWHSYTSSSYGTVAFTNLPYMSDAGSSCGKNSVNGGSAGVLDGVSIVAGHEIVETQTDPQLNAWYDAAGYENGDKCAWTQLGNLHLYSGLFAVQPIYSNSLGDCPGVPTTRSAIDASISKFTALSDSLVYVLGTDGKLWRENPNYLSRSQVDAAVAAFQPIDGSIVYVLGSDGNLWRESGDYSNRSLVDGTVASFKALDATTVYVQGTDGNLWRETGDHTNRSLVDGGVTAFQPLSGSTTVYVLRSDGNLWREYGSSASRNLVDGTVASFKALDATTVYVLGTDASLWREAPNSSSRALVDGSVAQFQPIDGTLVYVRGSDANLWREYGSATNRQLAAWDVAAFQVMTGDHFFVQRGDATLSLEKMY